MVPVAPQVLKVEVTVPAEFQDVIATETDTNDPVLVAPKGGTNPNPLFRYPPVPAHVQFGGGGPHPTAPARGCQCGGEARADHAAPVRAEPEGAREPGGHPERRAQGESEPGRAYCVAAWRHPSDNDCCWRPVRYGSSGLLGHYIPMHGQVPSLRASALRQGEQTWASSRPLSPPVPVLQRRGELRSRSARSWPQDLVQYDLLPVRCRQDSVLHRCFDAKPVRASLVGCSGSGFSFRAACSGTA